MLILSVRQPIISADSRGKPVVFCRTVFEQGWLRSGPPVLQLPAVWRRRQGLSGRGSGKDGAFPLPVLDPAALHPHGPTRTLSAQPGGQVWRGAAASQVPGECYAQTRLGDTVPGVIQGQNLFFTCRLDTN